MCTRLPTAVKLLMDGVPHARRVAAPRGIASLSFRQLQAHAQRVAQEEQFGRHSKERQLRLRLTYVDEEGDQVTIGNGADWAEAAHVAAEERRTSLRVTIRVIGEVAVAAAVAKKTKQKTEEGDCAGEGKAGEEQEAVAAKVVVPPPAPRERVVGGPVPIAIPSSISSSTTSASSSSSTSSSTTPMFASPTQVAGLDADLRAVAPRPAAARGAIARARVSVCNTGALAWPKACRLQHIGGDPVAPAQRCVALAAPAMKPGEERTVKVPVTIPLTAVPGRHVSYWRVVAADGVRFGGRLQLVVDIDNSNVASLVTTLRATPKEPVVVVTTPTPTAPATAAAPAPVSVPAPTPEPVEAPPRATMRVRGTGYGAPVAASRGHVTMVTLLVKNVGPCMLPGRGCLVHVGGDRVLQSLVPVHRLRLAPGHELAIKLALTVPAEARPGSHTSHWVLMTDGGLPITDALAVRAHVDNSNVAAVLAMLSGGAAPVPTAPPAATPTSIVAPSAPPASKDPVVVVATPDSAEPVGAGGGAGGGAGAGADDDDGAMVDATPVVPPPAYTTVVATTTTAGAAVTAHRRPRPSHVARLELKAGWDAPVVVRPRAVATKTFYFRNEGTVAWPAGVHLRPVAGGAQLDGAAPVPVAVAQPGQVVAVTARVVAPASGTATTYWQLALPAAALPEGCVRSTFGHRVWMDVVVAEPQLSQAATPVDFAG